MYCSKCGAQNQDTSKFCSNCSSPLNSVSPSAPQPVAPQIQYVQPPVAPQIQYVQTPVAPQPKKKMNVLLPVLIGVILLIVVFVIWAVLSPDSSDSSGTAASTKTASTTVPTTAATTAPTTAATTAATTTIQTTQVPAATTQPQIVAAYSPDDALWIVEKAMGSSAFEYSHEEFFIDNGDGTLSIDINTPEAADTACYVIAQSGSDGGYYSCYMVKEGTNEIYTMYSEDSGILTRIS